MDSDRESEADFEGFIPDLRDWVDARCNKFTDVEKEVWDKAKGKPFAELSPAERSRWKMLALGKYLEQIDCEIKLQPLLAILALPAVKSVYCKGEDFNTRFSGDACYDAKTVGKTPVTDALPRH